MKQRLIAFTLCLCSQVSASTAELITRESKDLPTAIEAPKGRDLPNYPWSHQNLRFPSVTKEFFRCRGSSLNPIRTEHPDKGEAVQYRDCDGRSSHGLPARDGQEFIYPILCELLSYLQEKTQQTIVITCGHRCPEHNIYADSTVSNQYSKHQIGAEVDFYFLGWENRMEELVQFILDYYKDSPDPSMQKFARYEKSDTNVSIPPWYNKEIFIKLHQSNEGRDLDNNHPYPYIGIQVRWDRDRDERVIYSWPLAHRGYFRS